MAVVSLKIGGRFYKFSCADGQENYMRTLAEQLDERAEQLLKNIGFMQEGQLLAMLCLLLIEEKTKLEKNVNVSDIQETQTQIANNIQALAIRVNALADYLAEQTKPHETGEK